MEKEKTVIVKAQAGDIERHMAKLIAEKLLSQTLSKTKKMEGV